MWCGGGVCWGGRGGRNTYRTCAVVHVQSATADKAKLISSLDPDVVCTSKLNFLYKSARKSGSIVSVAWKKDEPRPSVPPLLTWLQLDTPLGTPTTRSKPKYFIKRTPLSLIDSAVSLLSSNLPQWNRNERNTRIKWVFIYNELIRVVV